MNFVAHDTLRSPTSHDTMSFESASIAVQVQMSPQPSFFFSGLAFFSFAPQNA